MNPISAALRRPITVMVLIAGIAIAGAFAYFRMKVDIFPALNLPVIYVSQPYGGMDPQQMEGLIANYYEYHFLYINGIHHVESKNTQGVSLMKLYFHPGTDMAQAMAETVGYVNRSRAFMPPGTVNPFIMRFDTGSVPVGYLVLKSEIKTIGEIQDQALFKVRPMFAAIEGVSAPPPFGGSQRTVVVRTDPQQLLSHGLSADQVVQALASGNTIAPSGQIRDATRMPLVPTNAMVVKPEELGTIEVKPGVFLRDLVMRDKVAGKPLIEDASDIPTGYALVNGKRAVYILVTKRANASTLDVVNNVRANLPAMQAVLPDDIKVSFEFDQSPYVTNSMKGVALEGLVAAALVGLMVLVFLRDWRSVIVVVLNIPLALVAALVALWLTGQTINLMTLGGLALAVGILVDDATVTIENITRTMAESEDAEEAIVEGAAQIATPALVSTLAICIVFVPMFLLTGVARYLFVPLAEAVVFAMLASYVLSRTLVPTLAKYLLAGHREAHGAASGPLSGGSPSPGNPAQGNVFTRLQRRFEHGFSGLRERYRGMLGWCLLHRGRFLLAFTAACILSVGALGSWLGRDFFPSVDSGQFMLHVRARTGTRIEETARLCDQIESVIREQIPAAELGNVIDNIGLPYSGINLSYSNSAPIGSSDADVLVSLRQSGQTDRYVHALRLALPKRFPGVTFAFLPPDIVSQILNFGLPAPIDVQIAGQDDDGNRAVANQLLAELRHVDGITDVRIQQPADQPQLHLTVDRTNAQQLGLTQRDVANNLLVSLSGSAQTSPGFWLNPQNGVSYSVAAQTPQYWLDDMQSLENIAVTGAGSGPPQIMASLATIQRGAGSPVVSHSDIRPVIDLFASTQGRDLGAVAQDVDRIVQRAQAHLPRGSQLSVRGQIQTMRSSYTGLLEGLAFAILLVYLLIVVNFQSWSDPLIIIAALPAALAGIAWMFFLTQTNLSVPALTGSILCMGVATANSVLVISFARERLGRGDDAFDAALEAGYTRCRPVIMTALAMIIGMVPMALGLGEGGEQNAPLGRAVIGGLCLATVSTLLFVPACFYLVHGSARGARPSPDAAA